MTPRRHRPRMSEKPYLGKRLTELKTIGLTSTMSTPHQINTSWLIMWFWSSPLFKELYIYIYVYNHNHNQFCLCINLNWPHPGVPTRRLVLLRELVGHKAREGRILWTLRHAIYWCRKNPAPVYRWLIHFYPIIPMDPNIVREGTCASKW